MQKNITIKDIADALNYSYSTVSRALKGSYQISEETKRKVQEYADKHNYRPNIMAQSLRNNKTRSIGVMMSNVPNHFFSEVLSGIESVCATKDYHVILTQSLESYQLELKNLEHLTWRSVDGLLVSLSSETKSVDHFKKINNKGIPVVFFDRVTDQIDTHKIIADNIHGSYKLTSHFIENRFTRIAHITSSPQLSITKERLEGYYKALKEHHIPVDPQLIKYCDHGGMLSNEIESAVNELLKLHNPPDAIFTASDRISIGTLSHLHQLNIAIPDQVALGGFCDFIAPQIFNPSLTTIKQPAFEMGTQAAKLLFNLIEAKRPFTKFEKVVLETKLEERESSKRI